VDNDTGYSVDYSQYKNKPGNLKGDAKQKYQATQGKKISEEKRAELEEKPQDGVFYRSMGIGEYNAATKNAKFDFNAAFTYTNSKLYRWWITSSLVKAKAFDNDNVDKSEVSIVIVKFVFINTFLKDCGTIKAHQEKGVQGNSKVVAMHREGFMTTKLECASMNKDAHVEKVKTDQLAFNLGFTADQEPLLKKSLISIKVVT